MTVLAHEPGTLVQARGREWIIQPGSKGHVLVLRPMSGGDTAWLDTRLEAVSAASFPAPGEGPEGNPDMARLLHGALALSLRRGAGPFRSFGHLGFAPRPYQLVPLMMALKQDTVRLLVADDVGIGKTVEAGMIARELLDRGDIDRLCVLCPPHLVDQWVRELHDRFALRAVAVTASSAPRLERQLPMGQSLFQVHPVTVVSIDFVKSERHANEFIRACPSFVIVDEAHACAAPGKGVHLRHRMLRKLAEEPARHIVLLTATPHSGNDEAFHLLLGLLHPDFARLGEATGKEREVLRERLGQYLVQRRRPDIAAWGQDTPFPRRLTSEVTYRLTGPWLAFMDAVLDWCRTVTEQAGSDKRRQRLTFWGTLALVRCVSSSPAAALRALKTRSRGLEERAGAAGGDAADPVLEDWESQLLDADLETLATGTDDVEPGALLEDLGPDAAARAEAAEIRALLTQCQGLIDQALDPKADALVQHLRELVDRKDANPVVFCRYIATAEYLADRLRPLFPKMTVAAVTGQLVPEERLQRVQDLLGHERRLLVATDCLSEGINLQDGFDAVVHYDLSWNPTRHEQREGRIDRFGQGKAEVYATLMYGADNPVDGAVLQVILRKAQRIREELGVPVPLPDDGLELTQALMKAVLLRRGHGAGSRMEQQALAGLEGYADLETRWVDLKDKVAKNRTLFAQGRMKPEDVMPEWQRSQGVLGSADDVRRFLDRALARLGAPPALHPRGQLVDLAQLPGDLREQLAGEDLHGILRYGLGLPVPQGGQLVTRSHPLVLTLAEHLLGKALAETEAGASVAVAATGDASLLGRHGAWKSRAVGGQRTELWLLRLRHQLTVGQGNDKRTSLVEEPLLLAWQGGERGGWLPAEQALAILQEPASGDLPEAVRTRWREGLPARIAQLAEPFADQARGRADALLADHRRVRDAASARGSFAVRPMLPVDIVGAWLLLPEGQA